MPLMPRYHSYLIDRRKLEPMVTQTRARLAGRRGSSEPKCPNVYATLEILAIVAA